MDKLELKNSLKIEDSSKDGVDMEEDTIYIRPKSLLHNNPFSNELNKYSSIINHETPLSDCSKSQNIDQIARCKAQDLFDFAIETSASPLPNTNFPTSSFFSDESEIEFDSQNSKNQNSRNGSGALKYYKFETESRENFSNPETDLKFENHTDNFKKSSENAVTNGEKGETKNNGRRSSMCSDNLNISPLNTTGIGTPDVFFSLISFLAHSLSFIVDFTLAIWYYLDEEDFKWCSALTSFILIIGSFPTLVQFNTAEKDRLDRIFRNGKCVRILVNSFPPLTTIVSSFFTLRSAIIGLSNQMESIHYFAIEEFSQSLSRVHCFFKSAPQAALQLVIYMDTIHYISFYKGTLTLCSVVLSLIVMTVGNLPGRSELLESTIRKGISSPVSRLFLGFRMISSFGSRTMAIGYFLAGLRCLLGISLTFSSILLGLSLILTPRLILTIFDFWYHLLRRRKGREGHGRLSFCGTFTAYLATLFFPMSDPLWIFWFIWTETILFMTIGIVPSIIMSCIPTIVNVIYSTIFITLFLVIPYFLPLARARVREHKFKRLAQSMNTPEQNVTNLEDNTNFDRV